MRRAADAFVTATSPARDRPRRPGCRRRARGRCRAGRPCSRSRSATARRWLVGRRPARRRRPARSCRSRCCPATSSINSTGAWRLILSRRRRRDARLWASARRRCSPYRFWLRASSPAPSPRSTPRPRRVATRNSLETLAAQVGLALESAALTESVLRTQSEARLSALVQHSTDVILVLTPDTTSSMRARRFARFSDTTRRTSSAGDSSTTSPKRTGRSLSRRSRRCSRCATETSQAFEFRIRHRDGRLLHTECLITNLLDNAAVGGIVVNLRDITERKQFEEQLTYQAFHDPVTDLANRALFRDRVEHALSRRRDDSQPLAVLFLDLDDFKAVNDTFGHAAGDRVLQIDLLAPALRAARRATPWRGSAATSSRSCSRTSRTRPPSRRSSNSCSKSSGLRSRWTIARSRFSAASGSPSPARRATPGQPSRSTSCCATPMSRCTRRRPPAATPTATSSRRCTRPSSSSSRCARTSRRRSRRRS